MRWSLGFGPFRVYGGQSYSARRAAARRRARERARGAEIQATRAEAEAWRDSSEGRAYHERALTEKAERTGWTRWPAPARY